MIDEAKYDRQLRLWAVSGQSKLENSNICLLNSTTVGCETLKNLILPNVGKFTIIDDKLVDEDDLSSNFYLELDSLRKSRADSCSELLNELNTTVKHDSINKSVDHIIENEHESFWLKFDLIICTDLKKVALFDKLVGIVKDKVPMITCDSFGFYGILKIMSPERTIIDSHITELPDLRLENPWEELSDYVVSLRIEEMVPNQLKDLPYAVLLLHFRKKFIDEYQKNPSRKEFKQYVTANKTVTAIRFMNLENIEELLKFSWRATIKPCINENLKKILNELPNHNLQNPFWNLVESVRRFQENHDTELPLSGKIIDMASSTERYMELQNVYKSKAIKDLEEIKQYSREISRRIGSKPVNDDFLSLFCKNVTCLLFQEGSYKWLNAMSSQRANAGEEHLIFISYLAIVEFYRNNKRLPLANHSDLSTLVKIISNQKSLDITSYPKDEHLQILQEFIRSNGKELCNIAALMGGLAGQEALKILTNQYSPLNNTLIFDGIKSSIYKWFV